MPQQQQQQKETKSTKDLVDLFENKAKEKAPKTTPTEAPANAAYEGRSENADKDLRDLVDSGAVTGDAFIEKLYFCTVPQMKALCQDSAFMDKARAALPDASTVLRAFLAMHAEPQLLFHHYVKAGGKDQNELKQIISVATTKQLDALIKTEHGSKLPKLFPKSHPDNVLGEDFAAHVRGRRAIFNADTSLAWFMKWWGNTKDKFDLNGAYQAMSKDQDGLKAALKANPGTWNKVMETSPRGKALNQIGADALDRCVLQLDGLSLARIKQAFLVRFGSTLDAESGVGDKKDHLKKLWAELKTMPLEHVTSDALREFEVGSSQYGGGWYVDHIAGMGTGYSNIGSVEDLGARSKWKHFGETIRHEVGHAVDTKFGGYENYSSKCKAQWRRFFTGSEKAFAEHFARIAAGGNQELADAAQAYLEGGSLSDWAAACTKAGDVDKVLTGCDKNSVKMALVDCKSGVDVTAADGGQNINGHRFRMTWDSDYQSYAVAGEDLTNVSHYAYNSWAEFFAETYMHWFENDGKDGYCQDKKPHGGGGTLPSWVRGAGFASLVTNKEPGRVKAELAEKKDEKKKEDKVAGAS